MSFHKGGSPAAIATEVTSLFWLADAAGGAAVAEVVNRGQSWLETRRLTHGIPSFEDAARFGRRLARTHAAGAPHWGAPPPGLRDTDARLSELPAPVSSIPRWGGWGEFYAEARLRPYLRLAEIPKEARLVLHRAIDLVAEGRFDAPQPALVKDVARIHGDLWAGNVMWAVVPGGAGTTGTLLSTPQPTAVTPRRIWPSWRSSVRPTWTPSLPDTRRSARWRTGGGTGWPCTSSTWCWCMRLSTPETTCPRPSPWRGGSGVTRNAADSP